MKRGYDTSVWIKKVAFYLDGVSFWYKKNPYDQARTPKGRIWRTMDEALDISCTAKGSHVGSGGKVLHILVAISFNCGVVLCQEYEHMDGTFYSKFILEHFATILERSKKRSRLFIQDGDPSQNSASARKALKKVRANLLSIPPRSPDLNPIENIFSIVKRNLSDQAVKEKITCESFEQFTKGVKNVILNSDTQVINNFIGSMPRRIDQIITNKGRRLKY